MVCVLPPCCLPNVGMETWGLLPAADNSRGCRSGCTEHQVRLWECVENSTSQFKRVLGWNLGGTSVVLHEGQWFCSQNGVIFALVASVVPLTIGPVCCTCVSSSSCLRHFCLMAARPPIRFPYPRPSLFKRKLKIQPKFSANKRGSRIWNNGRLQSPGCY